MYKKITLSVILTAFLLRGGIAQDVVRMSLEDAISFALKNSSAIKAGQINITDADLQIKQSKATGLPRVDAEVNLQHFLVRPSLPAAALGFGNDPVSIYNAAYTQNRFKKLEEKAGISADPFDPPAVDGKLAFQLKNNFNGGITASQLIFSGSYTLAVRAANFYRSLVDVQLKKKQDSLRNVVIDAYLPTLLLDEGVKTLEKNITNLEKTFVEVKATYKAGFVEQLDVDRLEFSINSLKAQRDNLIRQREIPMNALKLTINYPLEKPLELTDDINSLLQSVSNMNVDEAIDYNKRPEIRELEATQKLLDLNVELQKAAGLPNVAAFGSYQYAFQGNTLSKLFGIPTSLIGLKATYNIWDSNERKIKTQRAGLALEQFRLARTDVERFINFQVSNARIAIKNAEKNLENQEKNLALAEKIYAVTQKKYKEGVGSSLELTTAERDIYQAQANVRQALYDLLVAKKSLQKALGN
jgi:outer membrane protein TolC